MTQLEPPHSNRGVVIDKKNDLTTMVDYVRCSFKTHDVDLIIENILHIRKEYMQELESGFYGYIGTYQLEFIKCFYSSKLDTRGTLVEMSGQGCRQFEVFLKARNKTWLDFFNDCLALDGTFTRFDLAIDDRKTRLHIPALLNKAHRGEVVSRFDNYDFNGSGNLNDGLNKGTTIYFGSKKSEFYLCFYEKNYEQAKKLKLDVEEIGKWNRYELRLKNDRATECVKALLTAKDMSLVALQILNNYIRFVDAGESEDKSTWKMNRKWEKFIGEVGKLRLYVKPNSEFYLKSKNWLRNSASRTMKMVLEADKHLGTNQLSDMILEAEMTKKQEHMLDVMLADSEDMVC
ncbi:replication initiation factor domain-containing protein [Listeria booriae]|uniref:Replication initiation factor domain-containing protein n=1 Tax=Listeria booriae TaxID=1552123 RepID=A0A841ZX43_9LIST|nr:replication initiation factor domain-containing protein [Listeria booriae]MBC1565064.1 replication initiation factor domain-containing protein [Listeria booriae]